MATSKAATTTAPIPSAIDGKPAVASHFELNPDKSSKAKPIAPVVVPPDTKWEKPTVAVQAAKPGGEKAVVTYVGDGDGASLKRKDGSAVNCRIDTIDAPEVAHPKVGKPGQAFGEEAKKTLQGLIERKEVTLTITKPADAGPPSKDNNYGRALCKIEVEGANVDQAMLKAGAAWLYRKYGATADPTLDAIEAKAKASKTGLWADPNAENPKDFRKRIK